MRAVTIVAVAACGSSAIGNQTALDRNHSASPVAEEHPAAGLAIASPFATPGERMTYELALQGLNLAVYELVIGDVQPLADKRALIVQSHAKTVGLGALVKVDDYFTSWIDVTTSRPLRWVCDEYASNGQDKEKTDAALVARQGEHVPILFHLNDAPPAPEPQHVSLPDVWDYSSFLLALRSWEAPAGTHLIAEVLRSRFLWHVEMTIHGKETLSTQLGNLPALRLDGHTYKLDRDGNRAAGSDERNFSVWISDDDGRVPLQVVARTDYGDIKMVIADYQPGNGSRLRP